MSSCRSCGARIVWVTTSADKAMPCDPTPIRVVTIDPIVTKPRAARVITGITDAGDTVRGIEADEATPPQFVTIVRVSHFATCPQTGQHRARALTPDPSDTRRLVRDLARRLGFEPDVVVAPGNGPRRLWQARRTVALALRLRGLGPAAIGRVLGGRDRSAVARAIRTARAQGLEAVALELSAQGPTACSP
jgi:hypothetical protein